MNDLGGSAEDEIQSILLNLTPALQLSVFGIVEIQILRTSMAAIVWVMNVRLASC